MNIFGRCSAGISQYRVSGMPATSGGVSPSDVSHFSKSTVPQNGVNITNWAKVRSAFSARTRVASNVASRSTFGQLDARRGPSSHERGDGRGDSCGWTRRHGPRLREDHRRGQPVGPLRVGSEGGRRWLRRDLTFCPTTSTVRSGRSSVSKSEDHRRLIFRSVSPDPRPVWRQNGDVSRFRPTTGQILVTGVLEGDGEISRRCPGDHRLRRPSPQKLGLNRERNRLSMTVIFGCPRTVRTH